MIRPAAPKEFPALLDVQIACIRDLTTTYTQEEINSWVGYLEKEGAGRYAAFNNHVFVDETDHIAGFVSWSEKPQERTAAIECLYTLKEQQGKGIGKLLLQTAEASLPESTAVYVRSTLNARPFYEKQGYHYIENTTSRAGFKVALLEKNHATRYQRTTANVN
ncbi:MAG TPA: GNAT family N-acetyltransferase [Candidatus Saccharimonadales bacterium]